MRILVTGAAGFIGSHLCDRFLTAGHMVHGIDTFETGRRENLPAEDGEFYFDKISVASTFHTHWEHSLAPELIVHCAASYSDRNKWHRDTSTNVTGSINVAIAAREWNARVVYFQTALIYADPMLFESADRPGVTQVRPFHVADPVAPSNSYSISKYAGGQYLRHSGVPLLEFRLANIYGPRNLSGPIPTFYKRLSAGEKCTVADTRRDFVYVQDLVELVDQAVAENATGTYHVSTGRDFSIHELYSTVADELGVYDQSPDLVERGEDDAPTILLDPSETKRDFGWQATTDLDEGIAAAVAWYRDNPVTETFTHLAEVKS